MEKYNKLIDNIRELIEKGLITSKDLKKEVEEALRFKIDTIASKLNLVSREEFEIQKKIIKKLKDDLNKLRAGKTKNKVTTAKKS